MANAEQQVVAYLPTVEDFQSISFIDSSNTLQPWQKQVEDVHTFLDDSPGPTNSILSCTTANKI